jgi:hypothetical protein
METINGGFLKKNWRQVFIVFFTLVIIAVASFHIGGNDFVYAFNSNISSPQALAILILTILLLRKTEIKSRNRQLWFGMMIGWILWAIAEWWWGIASFFTVEAPYPSGADFLWVLGYIPMYYALDQRCRSIPEETTGMQKTIMALISIVMIGITAIFIVTPIVQSAEPSAFLETFFTIVYPLADVILFIMVLRVAFKYQQGVNGQAWLWFSGGYILTTIADLAFSYANASGVYYPNGEVNFVSSIASDMLYSVSYMVILFGLSIMRTSTHSHATTAISVPALPAITNTHVLIFTDRDDIINDVSHNYARVFTLSNPTGQSLSSALKNPIETINQLNNKVRTKKLLDNETLMITTRFGIKIAHVSGESITSPDGEYLGEILLLRLYLEDFSMDDSLTEYEQSIVRAIMRKTGSEEGTEAKKLVADYYSAKARALYDLAVQEGGNAMGDSVLSKLQSIAQESNWPIRIGQAMFDNAEGLTKEQIRDEIPSLLRSMEEIVAEIADEESVKLAEYQVWAKYDATMQKNLMYCKKILGIIE